ncbi:hypothetical protein N9T26_02235 [Alphaproteobacteria bacterium]|nr:hypothetical protein [Alphaproteobacteria bacterium]
MRYICIIQSRTNSFRLPGKCFLPVGGMPLAVLCAKRAISNFAETWVATSASPLDNLLADRLKAANIQFYRGSLDCVLDRFCSLCRLRKINDNDVVIRLTGDNPIVDRVFLEKMKNIWESHDLEYLTGEPSDLKKYGWPKGLSAEFFRAGLLYASQSLTADKLNQEHVTLAIRNKAKKTAHMAEFEQFPFVFKKSFGIDTLDDYLFVSSLFDKVRWDVQYTKVLKLGAGL